MKYSVIIPVFKAEAYIASCLDSIFQQESDNYDLEVIVVDDGSPDSSSGIVAGYQAKHPNLFLLRQENRGVSAARNNGIGSARGDYAVFVDPDDVVLPNALERIDKAFKESTLSDVLFCNSYKVDSEVYSWKNCFSENIPYRSIDVVNAGFIHGSVWGGVFSLNLIKTNNIHFIEGVKNGEDVNFVLQVLSFSDKVYFANIDMYRVVGHDGSASLVYNPQRVYTMIESANKVSYLRSQLMASAHEPAILDYMLYSYISNTTNDAIVTPGIGYKDLIAGGFNKLFKIDLNRDIRFQRSKMRVLKLSFSLFYFLAWIKQSVKF